MLCGIQDLSSLTISNPGSLVPCSLNHWTANEIPRFVFLIEENYEPGISDLSHSFTGQIPCEKWPPQNSCLWHSEESGLTRGFPEASSTMASLQLTRNLQLLRAWRCEEWDCSFWQRIHCILQCPWGQDVSSNWAFQQFHATGKSSKHGIWNNLCRLDDQQCLKG